MNTSVDRQAMYDFMQQQPLATIATVNGEGQPEAALIAFVQTPKLEIIFETFAGTRKQRNIARTPHVALVIGWDSVVHRTMQYQGVAQLMSARDAEGCRTLFASKQTPCTDAFLHDPRVQFYTVHPTWISYSDYTGPKPQVTELYFKNLDKHKR